MKFCVQGTKFLKILCLGMNFRIRFCVFEITVLYEIFGPVYEFFTGILLVKIKSIMSKIRNTFLTTFLTNKIPVKKSGSKRRGTGGTPYSPSHSQNGHKIRTKFCVLERSSDSDFVSLKLLYCMKFLDRSMKFLLVIYQ